MKILNFLFNVKSLAHIQKNIVEAKLYITLNELRHGCCILKKLVNFFKFAVRNPSQSSPSSSILVPVWFIITFLVFSTLVNNYFEAFFSQFEGDFAFRKNDLKYLGLISHTLKREWLLYD